jgi:hypothetical protein
VSATQTLLEFEEYSGLSVDETALLLGCARATYYQWRREDKMPLMVHRHIEALIALPRTRLRNLISEHVYGDKL